MRPYSPTQTIGLSPTAKTKNAAKVIPGIKPFAPSAIFIALTKPTAKNGTENSTYQWNSQQIINNRQTQRIWNISVSQHEDAPP
jgi:hypothetical protein